MIRLRICRRATVRISSFPKAVRIGPNVLINHFRLALQLQLHTMILPQLTRQFRGLMARSSWVRKLASRKLKEKPGQEVSVEEVGVGVDVVAGSEGNVVEEVRFPVAAAAAAAAAAVLRREKVTGPAKGMLTIT